MGRKLDILLGRTSRQTSKLKSFLGLTVSRLAVLRNRRQVRRDQARGDVVQLLQLGHVDRALLRVRNQTPVPSPPFFDCLVIVHCCRPRECPEELREAISSLVFAASRCAELPELDKARDIFSSRCCAVPSHIVAFGSPADDSETVNQAAKLGNQAQGDKGDCRRDRHQAGIL
ncbi:hypothetical protein BHE74_00015656 [Ensete ventricosum]|uniref:Uncharacterized protein n=1 Tax=Ensete ventricosum TaxID=4639 RepID=A0A426YS72_ENSVE|nr:hypothetical protein B296_00046815 [Ensete ventricosum]RWW76269.1 hypothetical protein BHE74_00015656 [Ensete ventricosum]